MRFIIDIIKKIPIVNKFARYCFSKLQLLFYDKTVVKKINGIKYELDLSEMIDSAIYFHGYYERNTSRVLRQYIKPDMTIFEVGANIGAHTFEIAKMLDSNRGRLFSFEPTDYAFKKLEKNLMLNDFNNIVIEKLALSDVNEEKEIHRATSSETMPFKASWDIKKAGPKLRSKDKIIFEQLDDYFIKHNLDSLDLLKIDTDGYELRMVNGGRKTITKYKPIIIIELGVTVERVGDKLEDLVETLSGIGYSFYSIESGSKYDRKELIETVKLSPAVDCLCLIN